MMKMIVTLLRYNNQNAHVELFLHVKPVFLFHITWFFNVCATN